jgi:hypothetical protein
MNVNLADVGEFFKKYVFCWRTLAVVIAMCFAGYAYSTVTNRIVPMAYGSEAVGADPADVATTAVSLVISVITFVASNYLGVKPELVSALVAFEKDRTNVQLQRRLAAAVIGYLADILKLSPDGNAGYLLSILNTLISETKDQAAKEALVAAARTIAVSEYKVVGVK